MRRRQVLLQIFCTVHAAFLLLCIIPAPWPPRRPLLKPVSTYASLTASAQNWRMFTSAPIIQSLEVRVVIDGESLTGPIVPGLKPFSTPLSTRYYYPIERMLTFDDKSFRDAWFDQIAKEVAARGGEEFEIEIDTDYVRNFVYSTRDGQITKTISEKLGPFEAAENE